MIMEYMEHTKMLAQRLGERFGDRIEFILLFGSTARGEAGPDSDIDILIVGDKGIKGEVSKVRTEMDVKHGTLTTIVFKSREEFEEQRPHSDFLKEVVRESVALYGEENIARA